MYTSLIMNLIATYIALYIRIHTVTYATDGNVLAEIDSAYGTLSVLYNVTGGANNQDCKVKLTTHL